MPRIHRRFQLDRCFPLRCETPKDAKRKSIKSPSPFLGTTYLQLFGALGIPKKLGSHEGSYHNIPLQKNRNPSILCQLRTPLLQHCLFLLSCEGVDLGVQRGSERVLCCLADRLRKQLEEDSIDRTLGLKQPALCFGAVFWGVKRQGSEAAPFFWFHFDTF